LKYPLAPEHPFPKALEEAVRAYQWLPGWLHQQGIAKSPIALAGDSAGGGLVLSLILKALEKDLPPPACAVCFSPWTDLTLSGASIRSNSGRCHMFYPENLEICAAAYLNGASPKDKFASPLWADLEDFKKFPPLLLQVSSTELLLDDSVRLADKIKEAKGANSLKIYDDVFQRWPEIHEVKGISRLEIYDDVFHCWQMLSRLLPEARIALELAGRFININC
jgi:acetyl esterase/lipase